MKRIYLLRHAKAEWDDENPSDYARPLSPEGRDEALVMGEYMRKASMIPDAVLCSPARRTRETLETVGENLVMPVPVFETTIYESGCTDLLYRLRDVRDDAASVLLIGHNPAVSVLFNLLLQKKKRTPDSRDFPTCSLGVLSCEIDHWKELASNRCNLLLFVRPQDL